MSLPALQSHPWSELEDESLRSRVPESPLCAHPGWCCPASLRRRTCSRGGGVFGGRAAGLKVVTPALVNGRVTGKGSESGNGRWSSSWQSGPLSAPGAGWGWRIWGWFAVVLLGRGAGRSLKIFQEGRPDQASLNLGWGCVGWRGNGYQGGWWMLCRNFFEKWCGARLGCWKVWRETETERGIQENHGDESDENENRVEEKKIEL